MKKVTTLFFALGICATAAAQTGTIDSKKIFASIPEIAKVDTLVARNTEKYQKEFSVKNNETAKQIGIADSLYKIKPKEAATLKAIEVAKQLQADLQAFEKQATKEVADYKLLLYTPYLERINNAVKAVSLRRKYMQIININEVPLAYINPVADITEECITELKK